MGSETSESKSKIPSISFESVPIEKSISTKSADSIEVKSPVFEQKKKSPLKLTSSAIKKVEARVQPVVKKVIRLKETKSALKSGDKVNFQIFYQNPEATSVFLHYIDSKQGYEQPITQIRVKEIRRKVGEGIGSKAIITGPWEKIYN